ncbi:MAG: ribosomal protein S18-alanine N-acetyltransferase [Candidatus Brocadiia bacterium]
MAERPMASLLQRLRSALGRRADEGAASLDGVRIRAMRLADVAGVVAIEEQSFGSPWRPSSYGRAVREGRQHFFVAECLGRLVGYAGFWVEGRSAHIAKLAVHPDLRRQGIGSVLLDHLLDEIRRVGLCRAYLEVRQSNEAAQKLYARFGFRFERVQPRAYPNNGEDAFVLMRDGLLKLDPPAD